MPRKIAKQTLRATRERKPTWPTVPASRKAGETQRVVRCSREAALRAMILVILAPGVPDRYLGCWVDAGRWERAVDRPWWSACRLVGRLAHGGRWSSGPGAQVSRRLARLQPAGPMRRPLGVGGNSPLRRMECGRSPWAPSWPIAPQGQNSSAFKLPASTLTATWETVMCLRRSRT